jgi:hypothetical protein
MIGSDKDGAIDVPSQADGRLFRDCSSVYISFVARSKDGSKCSSALFAGRKSSASTGRSKSAESYGVLRAMDARDGTTFSEVFKWSPDSRDFGPWTPDGRESGGPSVTICVSCNMHSACYLMRIGIPYLIRRIYREISVCMRHIDCGEISCIANIRVDPLAAKSGRMPDSCC